MFKLFKKKEEVDETPLNERVINKFRQIYAEDRDNTNGDQVTEMSDDIINDIINEYLNKPTLTEANTYWYDVLWEYVEDAPYDTIPRNNGTWDEESPEFKAWRRSSNVRSAWSQAKYICGLEYAWVEKNGKANTNEEAAKKAADKWCEVIFGNHIQDNGAMYEDHAGGFMACALGTLLADKAKESITKEMVTKAHELFEGYYLHQMHYRDTDDEKDMDWLRKTLPTDGQDFEWRYGFHDLYCDYGPGWPMYMILLHAGIPEKNIDSICPWKTGINIRKEDNAVMYNTYQHQEEI